MLHDRVSLREAIKFHGHLGPYLVLGLLAGETALKKIKCKKYFGLDVKVWGAKEKPKSCLIDGLQLSSGATYGKGNIKKLNGPAIKIEFSHREKRARLNLKLSDGLIEKLQQAKTHQQSELLAEELYRSNFKELFNLQLKTYLPAGRQVTGD